MSFGKGYVQVYTGNGKGKTTAAIGLAIRALGAGKKVLFLQFMKSKTYNEHRILPNISTDLVLETLGKPFFVAHKEGLDPEILSKLQDECVFLEPGNPPDEYVQLIKNGFVKAKKDVANGKYDLVVLDEINVAMYFELIPVQDVLELIDNKSPGVELVLTGRNAPQEIIDKADLVTEMREVKHYYNTCGIEARAGIEN